jgi:hypothetical protein
MDATEILLTPQLPHQTYALIFLLGSLSVASISDLRRMAAQKDFTEVWWAYTIIMFLIEAAYGINGEISHITFTLKWALMALAALIITTQKTLPLATMDQAAIIALLSTLNPTYILAAIPATLLINELLKPILKKYGHAGAYPFLPTLFTVNLLTIIALKITT